MAVGPLVAAPLHGNSDIREILTPAERAQVAEFVSQMLDHPPVAD
ncbi:hypothetical protein [Kribbella sp. C-35]